MNTKKLFHIILNCLIITIFIGTGIAVLVLRHFANNEYDVVLLGTILIVVGVARAIIYYLNKGYKYPKDITIVSAIIMIGLGIVYLVSKIQIEVLCFGWGIMEIVLGSIETYIDTLEIRERKYIAWFELVVNVATIVFGILLCIHSVEGLTLHIIFLGISLFLYGAIASLKFIGSLKKEKNKKE